MLISKLSQCLSVRRPVGAYEFLVRCDAQVECDVPAALRNRRDAEFAAVKHGRIVSYSSVPCLIDSSLEWRWQLLSVVTATEFYLQIVSRYTFLFWRLVHYVNVTIHGIVVDKIAKLHWTQRELNFFRSAKETN